MIKINQGVAKYSDNAVLEDVEYLNNVSDKTNKKKPKRKVIFLFLLNLILSFGSKIK